MGKMYTFSGSPKGHEHLDVMHKLLKQFVPFAQKRRGFNKPVDINLVSDPQNSKDPLGKTAYYDPNNMKIALFVDKRHPKDLMRSLAHELTHHAQNCRGEFDNLPKLGEDYAQTNQHMREMERQAYEGTMLLRDFEDQLKKETTRMSESKINENKRAVRDGYARSLGFKNYNQFLKERDRLMRPVNRGGEGMSAEEAISAIKAGRSPGQSHDNLKDDDIGEQLKKETTQMSKVNEVELEENAFTLAADAARDAGKKRI